MPKRKHHIRRKNIFSLFLQYGFHLWILLFISNLLIFYSFHFFSFGAEKEPAEKTENITPTIAQKIVVPTKKPVGPVISLSFTIPGIGSGGGTMLPRRTTRNVTVYLYSLDVNSNDNKVKPLYSIKTTAEYDTNELSPSYTSFVNKSIDLGDTVKNGKYQVSFSTEQSLRKLIKEKETDIGGQVITIRRQDKATVLPLQQVIMGDTSPPQGNNVMDIADYNVIVDCFGKPESKCYNFKQADLNDDGVIDGIDYNILALGFKKLTEQGYTPPTLPTPRPTGIPVFNFQTTPKISPTSKPSLTAKPSPKVAAKNTANPVGGIITFLVFIVGLVGGFAVMSRTKFGKNLLATYPLPFMKKSSGAGSAASPATETPQDIAASTEIPVESLAAEKADASNTPPAEQPTAAPASDGSIDKTYYVKNKSKDEKGSWFTLTDDAGPIDGLYPLGTIEDGFEHIKGKMTEENGKKYLLITEVLPAD